MKHIEKPYEWHKARQKTIGGSEVGAIMGVNPRLSALQVYNMKVAEEPIIEEGNKYSDCGSLLEEAVLKMYSLRKNRKIIRPKKNFVHPEYPFMSAQVDGLTRHSPVKIVEAKTTDSYVQKSWDDEIPPSYYCQLQYQMLCSGKKAGDIALFVLNKRDIEIISFNQDKEFQEIIEGRVIDFWKNNVIKRVPPPPATEEDLKALFPEHEPEKVRYGDYEDLQKHKRLEEIKNQQKDLEDERGRIEFKIKEMMEDSERLLLGEESLFTWKSSESSRFDQKSFRKDHPELFDQYKHKSIQRKFLLKERKQ